MKRRNLKDIHKVIIHCSDSSFGDVATIRQWHLERSFDDIGYHYVILNGYRTKGIYNPTIDGKIENGRDLEYVGAHCKGENYDSIGICLIGIRTFTLNQFLSLKEILIAIMVQFNIKTTDIYGHYHFSNKTCPNFSVEDYLQLLFPKYSRGL